MSVGEIVGSSNKADERRREQKYFDDAHAARESAAAGWNASNWSASTAAEGRAFKRASEKRSPYSTDDPVAFGRVDLEDGDTYYIGRAPVFDQERNLLVLNWQAPAAAVYNQATAKDPQGVLRKRKFDAPANQIHDFEDIVFQELAADVAELEGWDQPDDELLKAMGRKRSGSMTDIVTTIQAAQDKIVRADKDQLLIVQGGPGTGKTAVALHRVSWLLFNYQDDLKPQDVLVIGPNPTFTRYIQRVLPGLGDNNVAQRSLQDFLAPGVVATGVERDSIASLKGSAVMADVLATALNDRIREPKEPVVIQRRDSGLTVNIPDDAINLRLRRLRSEIYLEGRAKLRETLIELAGPQLKLLRGTSALPYLDPRSLDAVVNSIWPQLSPLQLVRELLGSKDRLLRAAGSLLRASDVELLYRSAARSVAEEPWTMADLGLIDEAVDLMRGDAELFGHIVVDEAQDLSEMQLRAIRRHSRAGSITAVGDIAQSTGPYASSSWETVERLLQSSMPKRLEELEHGYRVPKEVFEVARPVLEAAAPGIQAPEIIRSAEAEPEFSEVDLNDLPSELAKITMHHSGKGRFVGVIAVADQWASIREAFTADDIQWRESTSGELSNAINLITPEDAKGLEFDAVIVVDPQAILDMEHGDRLLYIALTRTTTRLDVVYPQGTLPALLGGSATNDESIEDEQHGGESAPVEAPRSEGDNAQSADRSGRRADRSRRDLATSGGQDLDPLQEKMATSIAKTIAESILKSVQPELQDAVVSEVARLVEERK
ncbi:HelD family protein [Arthrobacter pigmenti]